MTKPVISQFYHRYFQATQNASWLARLVAGYRLKMLEELMQWDVTSPVSDTH